MSARICEFDGCERPFRTLGYCGGHYQQVQRGEPLRTLRPRGLYPSCRFDGCDLKHAAKGYCHSHYRLWRTGQELRPLGVFAKTERVMARDDRGRKCCVRCGAWKALEAFHSSPTTSDGLNAKCRDCLAMVSVERRFNITESDYRAMLAAQGGKCAICRSTNPGGHGRWCVDHDHACCPIAAQSCGACVRGLLCHKCNTTLGLMADDPERLRRAAKYLEGFK